MLTNLERGNYIIRIVFQGDKFGCFVQERLAANRDQGGSYHKKICVMKVFNARQEPGGDSRS